MRKFWLFLAVFWIAGMVAQADVAPEDYAFLLTAQALANPPSITIRWPQKNLPAIYVRRKLLTDANWGPSVTIAGNATSYVDPRIQTGVAYEYEFQGVVQANPQQIA